ncbi:MAG: efflux RND transporter periplasmic adaptor subunit [Planctomycetes bacterium]|nr:efflux RND transporter periplasmic adaptor subunit [Planctomycetota bacterium]
MTTTLSAQPATSSNPSPSVSAPVRDSRRGPLIRLGLPLAFVLIAVSSFLAYASVWRGTVADEPTVHIAQLRDLAVILEEKGELQAAKSVSIKSQVEGRSTIIWLIDEGTEVKEGELLVRLASDQIDDRVRTEEIRVANAQASAEAAQQEHEILIGENASEVRKGALALEVAEIELEKYVKGDWVQQHTDAELDVTRAEKVLERAELDWQDAQDLYEGRESKIITKSEWLTAQFNLYEAEVSVERAKRAIKILTMYTYPKELRQKESDVDESRKDLERTKKGGIARVAKSTANLAAKKAEFQLTEQRFAKYKQQQARTEIYAPAPGLVVYDTGSGRHDRRQISEGAEVYERQGIIKLPDPSHMQVAVRIHESNSNKVQVGQVTYIEVEGVPGQQFVGEVTRIASVADSKGGWLNPDLKEYETVITLNPTTVPLKPGVTATVRIIIEQLDDVLAIPVPAVYGRGARHFVFRGSSRSAEAVEIEVGAASNEFVEVRSGLAIGDPILLAVSDELMRLLPDDIESAQRGGGPASRRLQSARTKVRGSLDATGGTMKGTRKPPGGSGSTEPRSSSQWSGGKKAGGGRPGSDSNTSMPKKPESSAGTPTT